jgi:protease-4
MSKLGISETTIASTGARFKNAGSMFKPDDPVETAYFQNLIDQAFTQFKGVVSDGREGKLKEKIDVIANGKVYTALEASSYGLIDEIGYLRDAITAAAKKAGVSNYAAIRFEEQPRLSDLLFGSESRSTVPERGMTLHISPEVLDRMVTPRLMYLWRGD